MYYAERGCGSGRTPEQRGVTCGFCNCKQDFSGAGYDIQEQRSQLKPSTVDDVRFLHSNLKHYTNTRQCNSLAFTSNMSNFPSGAGRASISIYSGAGQMRNIIHGYGQVRVCKIRPEY